MKSPRRTFLAQLGLSSIGVAWTGSLQQSLFAAAVSNNKLPRSTPEAQGVASEAIVAFLDALAASKHEFHSFMLLRHGQVIAEGWWSPYRAEARHMLYSLSKSFTSTAVGFAVAEGRFKVTDPIITFFPDELPDKVSENLDALKVKDLLTMSVGHAEDSTGALRRQEHWVKTFLGLPIKNIPGTAFLYNSGATYMLSAIVQKVTGQRVLDYLTPRLFQPLGIEGMTWEVCPRGINTGGWGLSVRTEALAKFGQLYLQKGRWKDRQILPASWVDEATTFKIQQPAPDLDQAKKKSDWHQGYCYQFWRCRHNAFRGDGAFGQFTVVMPEQDAVLAITSESPSMQGELDLVWDHLLPGMKETPLPKNKTEQEQLSQKLCALALPAPKNQPTSPIASRISGKPYKLNDNPMKLETASLSFENSRCTFRVKSDQGDYPIVCGLEKWAEGEAAIPGTPPSLTGSPPGIKSKVSAAGTWKDENAFEMRWQFYETPHHDTVLCRFDEDKIRIEFLNSITQISPGHKETRPALQGALA
ncbi:MAG TPA: serine hydrolase [Candidatus Limnocylindrales bacterium]|nr:serine hydrolase [Candidatus Limnocylindrales bacterium]